MASLFHKARPQHAPQCIGVRTVARKQSQQSDANVQKRQFRARLPVIRPEIPTC